MRNELDMTLQNLQNQEVEFEMSWILAEMINSESEKVRLTLHNKSYQKIIILDNTTERGTGYWFYSQLFLSTIEFGFFSFKEKIRINSKNQYTTCLLHMWLARKKLGPNDSKKIGIKRKYHLTNLYKKLIPNDSDIPILRCFLRSLTGNNL